MKTLPANWSIDTDAQVRPCAARTSSLCAGHSLAVSEMPPLEPKPTERQGQYLAFIYYYAKINRRAPAEADIQRYFSVSAPTVHQMILTLEAAGFVERTAGQARSLRLLLAADQLPHLE